METPGMLVDRLMVVNLKLWHIEDKVRDESISGDELKEINTSRNDLNVQRNALIEELDEKLIAWIIGKEKPTLIKAHKSYGKV